MSDAFGKGYVSIHREIMDHWLWQDKPFSKGQAWIDLILLAKYKQEKFPYKDGITEGQRGTVYRSISWLAERWGWGRDRTRRFLDLLQEDGMITIVATTHQTTITLVNYGKFQNPPSANNATDNATSRQQADSQSATVRQQVDTYNKDNKGNNGNQGNNSSGGAFGAAQSAEEIEKATSWFDSLQED